MELFIRGTVCPQADSCIVKIVSLIVSILEVKQFIKSLLLCCWVMSAPADLIFFVNVTTVLNKYLGGCVCFLLKET